MHGCIILLKKSSQRIESNFSYSCSMYIAQCILHSYNTRKGKNVIRILSHLCPNIPYHLVAICIDLFQPPVTIIRIVLNMASRGKRLYLPKTFYYVHFNLVFLILGCEFPQEWQGEWNVEGERDSSHISIEDFGTKGFCLKEENDIYVIYNR